MNNNSDSDHDSTTVSYSLEEDRVRDLDEGMIDSPQSEGRPPNFEEAPPRYEDVVEDEEEHRELLAPEERDSSMMEEGEVEEGEVRVVEEEMVRQHLVY